MNVESLENPNLALGGGAGIQSAQLLANYEVEVVLTGNCGPNAFATLNAAGIEVIVGASGVVRQVVEGYKQGAFSGTSQANVASHFGMSSTTGYSPAAVGMAGGGMGGGGGGGMGRGQGRGMGRGMGMGGGMVPPVNSTTPAQSSEQELETLKIQAQSMAEQLSTIQQRIGDLEKKK